MNEPDQLEAAFKQSATQLSCLDVLVNNVGIARLTKLRDSKLLDDLDAFYKVNMRANLHVTQLARPMLVETKGCIVNIASIASHRAAPQMLPYAMSKGAISSMTRSLAADLGRKGVRVNEIK